MVGDAYNQIKRPPSRVAEKILGWLSWILLLAMTIVAMFFGLVLFSNENSIQSLENNIANNSFFQDILANNNMTATQLVIMLQNGVWAFIVYLIICLLISFLALISMNYRIVSGLLFLITAIITIPVFFILVPLFFFIVAMMMFIRKGYVEREAVYYEPEYDNEDTARFHTSEVRERPTAMPERDNGIDTQNTSLDSDESEPEVLSRTAKYNHKPIKSKSDETNNHDSYNDMNEYNESEQIHSSDSEIDQQNMESLSNHAEHSDAYVTQDTRYEDLKAEKEARKEQKKAEKARLREARKQKRADAKAERKSRPSATVERRKNFDDRLKLQQKKAKEQNQEHDE
ncbi:lipoteichoic acid stability factor AuxB [Staphylococcus canis]|uniref:DUF4064 domain-containing protein n=1 Tax=Staphylococcus canis TaxID=2724942 RepID=A0ABS0TBN8_9STAP|nr:DUF4064 domain-containing protein [Staphylococcus canis]MBI5975817.1 DUF4064 domain-containing protein [Staphylococcus canis]